MKSLSPVVGCKFVRVLVTRLLAHQYDSIMFLKLIESADFYKTYKQHNY